MTSGDGDDDWPEGHRLESTRHTPRGPRIPVDVELNWRVVDGRPECDGIHITSPTGAPITATDLRKADVPSLIGDGRAQIVARTGRGHTRRSTSDHLKEVARVYSEAFSRGQDPVVAVRKHFEAKRGRQIKAGTVSSWVSRARNAQLLPPTTRGAPRA
jgi:hypothetical protein